MQRNNTEVKLLIRGKQITEYEHNGNLFVEGRQGSEFEIEIVNRNNFRIEAVISVDGLSITDGKDAGTNSAGYLVEANSTVRVPGWKLSNEQVAAFFFSGKKQSYATQSTGSSRNNGVIGAMIFRERPRTTYQNPIHGGAFPGGILRGGPFGGGYVDPSRSAGGVMGGGIVGQPYNPLSMQDDYFYCLSASASSGSFDSEWAATKAALTSDADLRNTTRSATRNVIPTSLSNSAPDPVNNIGTGFGAAQEYRTTEVNFERGDMLAMMILYYDDARGLRARGIELGRKTIRQVAVPQAFPQMSCKPPQGWRG